jgi:hypothetical protein
MSNWIHLPQNVIIGTYNEGFTEYENQLMVEIGSMAVLSLKRGIIQIDLEKYKTEYENKIVKLEQVNEATKHVFEEILEREKERKTQEIISEISKERLLIMAESDRIIAREKEISENQINTMRELLENTQKQIREMEIEKTRLEETIKNTEDRNDFIIKQQIHTYMTQKENEIHDLHEEIRTMKLEEERKLYQESVINTEIMSKTIHDLNQKMENIQTEFIASKQGKEGEILLLDIMGEAFADLDDFEIVNTSNTAHMGDFHLRFRDFTVMVDSKNFINSTGVSSTDRRKLKADLRQNQHIKIAWMISLSKPIHCYAKAPFMMEIDEDVCYCYVNSLMKQTNPQSLLKTLYYNSKMIFDTVLNDIKEDSNELARYKKNEDRIRVVAENMNRLSKERYAIMKQMNENFENQDKYNRELITNEVIYIQDIRKEMVIEWWSQNMIYKMDSVSKTDKLYHLFGEMNNGAEQRISKEEFKQIIVEIVKEENVVKGKTAKTQYTIRNWEIKNV